tara:strand:+ start:269 stop:1180 length:912 start_codon:yes stop_codon:yes gene_type:complete
MKHIIKIFLATILVFSFNSCEDSNAVVDQVVAETEAGAILRTIADDSNSNVLNSSDAASSWSQVVEEQDNEGGALLESVSIYVSIRDLSPDNGFTDLTKSLIKTIPAADFTSGPVDLPRATMSSTFGEAAAAMGLSEAEYAPGDLFVFDLELNLTDGRTYGSSDAAGIITGGYWASPYKYNAALVCSPAPGDYAVDMQDSYGDAWQGDGIRITLTDASGTATEVYADMLSTYDGGAPGGTPLAFAESVIINVPAGTDTAIWEYTGDSYPGEVSFQIYSPTGDLLLAVGQGEGTPGLLPVTNCL